jgi:hypothetical protein
MQIICFDCLSNLEDTSLRLMLHLLVPEIGESQIRKN